VLPFDDRPGGRVEGNRPDLATFAPDRRLPVLYVLPLEVQDLGLSHASVEAELDQVREGFLERARALFRADLPAGLEYGLGLVVGERLDDGLLPIEFDLLQRILALVDLPIDRLVEHSPEELHVPIKRGLAAGSVDSLVADLDLPGLEPASQLLEVVGRDVGEVGDIDRIEELEDLLHPPGLLVGRSRLRVPGPREILQREFVDGDVLLLGLGHELVLDVPGLLERQTVLAGLERAAYALALDPDIEPIIAAVLLNHGNIRYAYS